MPVRRILHVDMDAFYASVEQRDDPSLKGKPLVVGGDANRGVVAAASYEARVFGIRSAMPMSRAKRLCAELKIVKPSFEKYQAASREVFEIFRSVTPLVEGLSLDEAYLDVTENAWGLALGMDVARRIKDEIKAKTKLTASAGVAPNKFLAKIASGWKKPDGLTVIAPSQVDAFLQKLPVDALWGVGPVTAAKLRAIGLEKLVDVRTADPETLRATVGSYADELIALAHGHDDRAVEPHRERKSVGTENTFNEDLRDVTQMRAELDGMAREVTGWLEKHDQWARTVTLKVRYENFETVTRADSRDLPTRDPDEVAARAIALLERTDAGTRAVRLLGVSLTGLTQSPDPPPRPHRKTDERQLVLPLDD